MLSVMGGIGERHGYAARNAVERIRALCSLHLLRGLFDDYDAQYCRLERRICRVDSRIQRGGLESALLSNLIEIQARRRLHLAHLVNLMGCVAQRTEELLANRRA